MAEDKPKKRGRPPLKKNKEKAEKEEKKKIYCSGCKKSKALSGYYRSENPMHLDGVLPLCKNCVRDFADDSDIDSVYELLRTLDKPFLYNVWESALKSEDNSIGTYIKFLNLRQHEKKTWEDSVFTSRQMEEDEKHDEENTPIESVMQKKKRARKMSTNIKDKNLSPEEVMELEDKWGYGYDVWEMLYFERKYNSLVGNYPSKTSLHEEALRTYCIYKVKAELATASGDIKDAKVWAEMAQKQGEIAKINLNKLNQSDLSQGLDGFSSLARMIEKHVDIIPILPKFIGNPNDKIDFALWCYINYERKLHGLPEVDYHEIYDFYQKKLEEHAEKNEMLRNSLKEHEIDTPNGKKKILIYDTTEIVKKKKEENPNDSFIQNLDKWIEFASWAMWNQDLFYDLITPENGGIEIDPDQRILLRAQGRFQSLQGVFSRGYGKCVAGDTMLFTNEGVKEIGEFFNYQKDDKETYYEHRLNVINMYGKLDFSDKGVYSGYQNTKIINTQEGYEIEGTLEHPLLVMEDDKQLRWKKMKDISVGDYLPISRNNNVWGDKHVCLWREIEDVYKGAMNPEFELSKDMMRASKTATCKLLYHIFDTECFNKGNYYSTLSKKFSYQIQMLLLNLGIIAKVKKDESSNEYVVEIVNNNKSSKYFYSKVESINDSSNHVYDIQVPHSNSFIGNGLVNHNTFLQLMNKFSRSLWRPNSNIAMSAQTRENASSLVKEKFHEILRFYPLLHDEIKGKPVLTKDVVSIDWKSGSNINVLANQQSAKGARRHSLTVEESAQTNQTLFEDWVLTVLLNGNIKIINLVNL